MIISLNMSEKLRPEDVFHHFFKNVLWKFLFFSKINKGGQNKVRGVGKISEKLINRGWDVYLELRVNFTQVTLVDKM